MLQIAALLIALNVFLLLAIGLIRQENPFTFGVLFLLSLANAVTILAAAVLGHDPASSAVNGLATNLLPVLVVLGGIAALVFVLTVPLGDKRS